MKSYIMSREHFPHIAYFDTLMYRMVQAQMVREDLRLRKSRGEFIIDDDENDISWYELEGLAGYLQEEFITNLHDRKRIKDESARKMFDTTGPFRNWNWWYGVKQAEFIEVSDRRIEFRFYADFKDPGDEDYELGKVSDRYAKVHACCYPGFRHPTVVLEIEMHHGKKLSNTKGRMGEFDYGDFDFVVGMQMDIEQALMQHVRNEKVKLLDTRYEVPAAKRKRQAADLKKRRKSKEEA